jgi:nucleoside-diphosphate-sugar epimerase
MWVLSPRSTVHNLIHAHEVDADVFGSAGAVNLPGLSITVGEMVAAMGRVAGDAPVKLIQWEEDAAIMKLVRTWPGDFITTRAESMGFTRDTNYDDVVRAYIDDELNKH